MGVPLGAGAVDACINLGTLLFSMLVYIVVFQFQQARFLSITRAS